MLSKPTFTTRRRRCAVASPLARAIDSSEKKRGHMGGGDECCSQHVYSKDTQQLPYSTPVCRVWASEASSERGSASNGIGGIHIQRRCWCYDEKHDDHSSKSVVKEMFPIHSIVKVLCVIGSSNWSKGLEGKMIGECSAYVELKMNCKPLGSADLASENTVYGWSRRIFGFFCESAAFAFLHSLRTHPCFRGTYQFLFPSDERRMQERYQKCLRCTDVETTASSMTRSATTFCENHENSPKRSMKEKNNTQMQKNNLFCSESTDEVHGAMRRNGRESREVLPACSSIHSAILSSSTSGEDDNTPTKVLEEATREYSVWHSSTQHARSPPPSRQSIKNRRRPISATMLVMIEQQWATILALKGCANPGKE